MKKSADLCFPKMVVSEPHHIENVTFKRGSGNRSCLMHGMLVSQSKFSGMGCRNAHFSLVLNLPRISPLSILLRLLNWSAM